MNYKKLLSFLFLTIISMTTLHAEILYLQCDVGGAWDEQRLNPAQVLVTITNKKNNFLHIDIDGPDDYAMGASSLSYEKDGARKIGKNLSQEKMYWVYTAIHKQNPSIQSQYNITINRVSGQLNANVTHFKGNSVSRLSYSGMCRKASSANKF